MCSRTGSGLARQVPLVMVMNNIPYSSLALEVFRVGMDIPDMTIHASSRIKAALQPVLGLSLGDRFIPTDSVGQIFVNYRGLRGRLIISVPSMSWKKNLCRN